MPHVVWDWNGTLFDDFEQVVEAVNEGLVPYGIGPIDATAYRDHYTRPVKRFYDSLLGREVGEDEWVDLDRRFHDAYRRMLGSARLAAEAEHALADLAGRGVTQSLLSMYPHDELVELVERFELGSWFVAVDGLRGSSGDRKAGHLAAHLGSLGVDPATVLLVGDALDDAEAAAAVGAACVLYHSGSHHRQQLEAAGVPVIESLIDVVHHLPPVQSSGSRS